MVLSSAGDGTESALHCSGRPSYALSGTESEGLLSLLHGRVVSAPWHAEVGLDGATSELVLQGPMSQVSFRWWGRAPAEWEGVEAAFRYAMRLAGRGEAAGPRTSASSEAR